MTENEKKFAEAMTKLCISQLEQDKCILECDSISIKFWQMELKSLLENEPFYMFKKKHQEWEEKVVDTKEHLEHLYKLQEETMKNLKEWKSNLV